MVVETAIFSHKFLQHHFVLNIIILPSERNDMGIKSSYLEKVIKGKKRQIKTIL